MYRQAWSKIARLLYSGSSRIPAVASRKTGVDESWFCGMIARAWSNNGRRYSSVPSGLSARDDMPGVCVRAFSDCSSLRNMADSGRVRCHSFVPTWLDLHCPSFALLNSLLDSRQHCYPISTRRPLLLCNFVVQPAVHLDPAPAAASINDYPEPSVLLPLPYRRRRSLDKCLHDFAIVSDSFAFHTICEAVPSEANALAACTVNRIWLRSRPSEQAHARSTIYSYCRICEALLGHT